jgi:hypothetical protein
LIDIKYGKLRKNKRKSIMVSVRGVGHKRLKICRNVTLQISYKNKCVRAYRHVNNEFKTK